MLALVPSIPYVLLRHGLLAPFTLVILGAERAAEAGFGLFALQMPGGVWFAAMTLSSSKGTTAQLAAMIVATLLAAVLWTEFVQRPLIARWKAKETGVSVTVVAREAILQTGRK